MSNIKINELAEIHDLDKQALSSIRGGFFWRWGGTIGNVRRRKPDNRPHGTRYRCRVGRNGIECRRTRDYRKPSWPIVQ